MTEITIEKVYNKWLAITRKQRNKPFSLRKDFSNITKEEFYPYLEKLTNFFKAHPHLFRDEFFIAPFEMYTNDKGYYSLKFYSSHKGLVTCSKYFDSLEEKEADTHIEQVKKSYEFIAKFCVANNIQLRDYPFYKKGLYPEFLIHLKNRQVDLYVLFSFPALYFQVMNLHVDEKIMFFGPNFKLSDYEKKYKKGTIIKEKSIIYFSKVCKYLSEKISI